MYEELKAIFEEDKGIDVDDFIESYFGHFVFGDPTRIAETIGPDFHFVLSHYPAQIIQGTYLWMIATCKQRPTLAAIKEQLDRQLAPILDVQQLLTELLVLPVLDEEKPHECA